MKWTRLQVSNATKFLAFASLLALAGCSGDQTMEAKAPPVAEKKTFSIETPALPTTELPGAIHDGEIVRLGDSKQLALEVFPKPAKATSFREELPFISETARSEAWEGSRASLALITKQDRLVLLVFTEEQVERERINDVLAQHEKAFGSAQLTVPGGEVAYWFWSKNLARLMICVATNPKGQRSLTIATGDYRVMDELRMSGSAAEEDQRAALDALAKLQSKPK